MTDFSVNTNPGSFVALQSLSSTNKLLERTQLRVTTGLKVNGPKDDAATYAIAQNQRGDIAGFRSVKTALAAGGSTVNVAITGGKSISARTSARTSENTPIKFPKSSLKELLSVPLTREIWWPILSLEHSQQAGLRCD